MVTKKKNHFVPKLILKQFVNESNNLIWLLNKNIGILKSLDSWKEQCQKSYFYSKKSLSELLQEFSHIQLNPIFTYLDKNLEDNFDLCIERTFGSLIEEIKTSIEKLKLPNLDDSQKFFIKEYCSLQHLRTLKFKKDMIKINEELMKLPEGFEGELVELLKQREILRDDFIKAEVKRRNPKLNFKARREEYKKIKKIIRKNPAYIQKLRTDWYSSSKYQEELEKQKNIARNNLESLKNHIDLHSANILDINFRNSFFEIANLDEKNISYIYLDDKNSFILPDTGILLTTREFKIDDEVFDEESIIYLQITPKILIKISKEDESLILGSSDFVKLHNKLCFDECLNNLYSLDENSLKKI